MSSIVQEKPAPNFDLLDPINSAQVALSDFKGKKVLLLFFPKESADKFAPSLIEFQNKKCEFDDCGVVLLGISDLGEDNGGTLAQAHEMQVSVLSDSEHLASADYGAISPEGAITPTVVLIDEDGIVKRIYEASQYPDWPNAAMPLRVAKRLSNVVKAPPVTDADWKLGSANAPVVFVEYSDYQCHHCAELHIILEQIREQFASQILFVHRHLPLRSTHPLAQLAAEAAESAGAQGKFWEMHHRLFMGQNRLEQDALIEYARELNLDVDQFIRDLDSGKWKRAVDDDWQVAVFNQIKLPPTLFINGILWRGKPTTQSLVKHVQSLLL